MDLTNVVAPTNNPKAGEVIMKRCQQCDFVYEDEQQLCDMDGAQLVFDSSILAESISPPTDAGPAQQTKMSVCETPISTEAPDRHETVAHEEMTVYDKEQMLFEALADSEILDSYEGKTAASSTPTDLLANWKTDLLVIADRNTQQPRLHWYSVSVIAVAAVVMSAALLFVSFPSRQTETQSAGQQTQAADAPADQAPSLVPAPDADGATADPANSPTGAERSNTGSEEGATPNSDISVNRVTTERSSNRKALSSTRPGNVAGTSSRRPSVKAKIRPSRVTRKKGSRVGSLLQTTGRAIKRPFKF